MIFSGKVSQIKDFDQLMFNDFLSLDTTELEKLCKDSKWSFEAYRPCRTL